MFLLVPAYLGSPGTKAVKRLLLFSAYRRGLFSLIEAGPQIKARSLIHAGGLTAFVLGSNGEYHRANDT